jgi:hypothetical protein
MRDAPRCSVAVAYGFRPRQCPSDCRWVSRVASAWQGAGMLAFLERVDGPADRGEGCPVLERHRRRLDHPATSAQHGARHRRRTAAARRQRIAAARRRLLCLSSCHATTPPGPSRPWPSPSQNGGKPATSGISFSSVRRRGDCQETPLPPFCDGLSFHPPPNPHRSGATATLPVSTRGLGRRHSRRLCRLP